MRRSRNPKVFKNIFKSQVLVPFPPSGRWHLSLLSHCHMAGQGRRWDVDDDVDDDDGDGDDGDDDYRSLVIYIFVVSILADIQKEPCSEKFNSEG